MLTSPEAQMQNLLRDTPTATLVTSLLTLAAMPHSDLKAEYRLIRARIIDELERRYPEASGAVEAAYLAADTADTYQEVDCVTVLINAIPPAEYGILA